MRYFPFKHLAAGVALAAVACGAALAQKPDYSGIGKTPTPEEIQAIDRGAGPSGKDLPPGRGSAKDGARIYAVKCAMCHGQNAEGVREPHGSFSQFSGPRVGGGTGTPLWPTPGVPRPVVTLSYYAGYPTTIYNAISIGMPFFRPGTLTPDEVYALTAFVFYKNNIIKEDDVMDRETLPKVQMPNRNGMVPDKLEDLLDLEKRACRKTYGVCN